MDRKDLLLLVLAAAGSDGLSPVQLQKSLFLLENSGLAGLPAHNYEFVPYNYGPFDPQIYEDADELANSRLVAYLPMVGRDWRKYVVAPAGTERVQSMGTSVEAKASAFVFEVVDWVKRQSFAGLLRAIYAAYPQYRVNSVFRG